MPGLTGHLIPTPVVREIATIGVFLVSLILVMLPKSVGDVE